VKSRAAVPHTQVPAPARDGAKRLVGRLMGWGLPRAKALYALAGIWLTIAFVVAALGLFGFAELAQNMAAGATRGMDESILRWMDAHATARLTSIAIDVTNLGGWLTMTVMGLLVSVFLWIHGQRRAVALLWIGLLGTVFLNDLLKGLFGRTRPAVFEWRTASRPSGYSFPSGHALNITVAYTLFAFLVARLEATHALRVVTFVVAAAIIVGVATSRVYLGVHYPSDVIAGILVGFAWAMACVFAVYILTDLRRARISAVSAPTPTGHKER
jgi:undecaprenyl-diphosphatase